MFQTMAVSAFAHVKEGTNITFLTGREGMTEFSFDKDLMLTVNEGALEKLAEVVTAAVEDRRHENALEELEELEG